MSTTLEPTLWLVIAMLVVLEFTLLSTRLEAWKARKSRLGAVVLQISFELSRLSVDVSAVDQEIEAVESDPKQRRIILGDLESGTGIWLLTSADMVRDLIRNSLIELPGELVEWWIILERSLSNLRFELALARLPPFPLEATKERTSLCRRAIDGVRTELERFNTDAKLAIELRAPEFLHGANGSN